MGNCISIKVKNSFKNKYIESKVGVNNLKLEYNLKEC